MRNILPIILIVISIGLFYFDIAPQYTTVETLMAQKSQYADAITKVQEVSTLRDELLTKYNGFSADNIARLERLVPENINTVKLVSDLNSVAGTHGITIKSVSVSDDIVDTSQTVPDTTAPQKPYNTTTISFKFDSTYPDLVTFLQDLEHSLQVVDVKAVTFQVPPDNVNTGVFEYAITIQTYYLKQ